MHPAGKASLTSGVLPRKALALARDWVGPGLAAHRARRCAPGPVLVETDLDTDGPGAAAEGLGVRHRPELPVARHARDVAHRRDPRRHADRAAARHARPSCARAGSASRPSADDAGGAGVSVYDVAASGARAARSDDDPARPAARFTRARAGSELDLDAALARRPRTRPRGTRRAAPRLARGGPGCAAAERARSTCGCRSARRRSSRARRRQRRVSPGGSRRSPSTPTASASTPPRPTAASGTPTTAARRGARSAGFAATDVGEIKRPAHRHACGAILVDWRRDRGRRRGLRRHRRDEPPAHAPSPAARSAASASSSRRTRPASTLDDPWTREAPNLIGAGRLPLRRQPGGTTRRRRDRRSACSSDPAGEPDVRLGRGSPARRSTTSRRCAPTCSGPPATARGPERLWVWVQGGDQAGLWVRDDGRDRLHADRHRRVVAPAAACSRRPTPPDHGLRAQRPPRHGRAPAQLPALYQVAAATAATPAATSSPACPTCSGARASTTWRSPSTRRTRTAS